MRETVSPVLTKTLIEPTPLGAPGPPVSIALADIVTFAGRLRASTIEGSTVRPVSQGSPLSEE
jgi:hypothetical protein